MEIFEPKNFFDLAGLLVNVFTGVVAIVGLLIALLTYKVATEAINTWKQQKSHEIEDEAVINMDMALEYLRKMLITSIDIEKLTKTEINIANDILIKTDNEDFYKRYMSLLCYKTHHIDNEDLMKIKKTALKLFRVSTDKEIIKFYNITILISGCLYSAISNHLCEQVNNYIKKYNFKHDLFEYHIIDILDNNVPSEFKKIHSDKSIIEISYLFHTGPYYDSFKEDLQDIENKFMTKGIS